MSRDTAKSSRKGGLTPWSANPLAAWRAEMEDLFNDFWGDRGDIWSLRAQAPSVDLAETDAEVEVKIDLPGVQADQIDVQLNGDMLTVSGSREEEKEEKNKTFHRVERRSGNFSQSVRLPCAVQEEGVTAKFNAGVLSVKLPKSDEAKTRRIPVDQ